MLIHFYLCFYIFIFRIICYYFDIHKDRPIIFLSDFDILIKPIIIIFLGKHVS